MPHLNIRRRDACSQDQRIGAAAIGNPVMPAGDAEGIAIVAVAAFKPVVASAAIKAVCAAVAEDQIIAGPAGQHIVKAIAPDHIAAAAGGAGQGKQGGFAPHRAVGKFDPAHTHARSSRTAQIDPVPRADDFQHDIDSAGNHPHIGRHNPRRKAQRVGARRIGNHILPIAAREQVEVIAKPALKHVVAGAAGERIVAACANQGVVACSARQARGIGRGEALEQCDVVYRGALAVLRAKPDKADLVGAGDCCDHQCLGLHDQSGSGVGCNDRIVPPHFEAAALRACAVGMVKSQDVATSRNKTAQALRKGFVAVRRIKLGPVIAVRSENPLKPARNHVGIATTLIVPARQGRDVAITPACHLTDRHLFKTAVG